MGFQLDLAASCWALAYRCSVHGNVHRQMDGHPAIGHNLVPMATDVAAMVSPYRALYAGGQPSDPCPWCLAEPSSIIVEPLDGAMPNCQRAWMGLRRVGWR